MKLQEPATPTQSTQQVASDATERALHDYYLGRLSRELSNIIRRDVLTGRAKFGVSDDGKELYQLAMAKVVEPGDFRADYYRGHTLLLALGICSVEDILGQLYANAAGDPFSKGRQMVGHHATATVNPDGTFRDQTQQLNISAATSPTAGQMARGLGLAFASKVYRRGENLPEGFSHDGREIAWTEIGDASTSEGVFWETMNAAGVLEVPLVATVADDGYGISVPVEYQTTKSSISAALKGLKAEPGTNGIDIYEVKGWNYEALCEQYARAARVARDQHRAVLIHVTELTQPNGHSTSGSHERYKDEERLGWEKEYDCLAQFRHWLIATEATDAETLAGIEKRAKKDVMDARRRAWSAYQESLQSAREELLALVPAGAEHPAYVAFRREITREDLPKDFFLITALRKLRLELGGEGLPTGLRDWLRDHQRELRKRMGSDLLSETPRSPLRVPVVPPTFGASPRRRPAYEILQRFFREKFRQMPELFAFGEDVGKIGDVNQGFAGIQEEFGEKRIFDTGIREWTIVGQAMGMAMRGLRPIAEIQYLDYIFYALPLLTDDVATLRWRSAGQQAAPLIIRTRGHRLEGVWHSGSYLAPLIHSLRGMHLCVPRNVVQAAGMYNTLLRGDDPAVVIEVLNGYRLHEDEPTNLSDFTVPLGVPECVREGTDVTLVTYGACVGIAQRAAEMAERHGVSTEIVDVQTLLPFDLEHRIADRLRRTNRLLILDEDLPGATSAYIQQQILEVQQGYRYLDAPVRTLTAAEHRPAYGDDGNYSSKPVLVDVVEALLALAAE